MAIKTAETLRLEWLDPDELEDNPQNWRRHPATQEEMLRDVMEKVGWAGCLLYNEATGHLIDGHLRKKIAKAGEKVPVLVGNWSEEEEKLLLATLDPMVALAKMDEEVYKRLVTELDEKNLLSGPLLNFLEEVPLHQVPGPTHAPKVNLKPKVRSEGIDLIFCSTGAPQHCVAALMGWKYGVQEPAPLCPFSDKPFHKVHFVDNNFKNYNHARYIGYLKEITKDGAMKVPLATALDIITEGSVGSYYPLEQILD